MLRVVTLRHTEDRQEVDDEEDSDVIICSLDVIDGLIEGLEQVSASESRSK